MIQTRMVDGCLRPRRTIGTPPADILPVGHVGDDEVSLVQIGAQRPCAIDGRRVTLKAFLSAWNGILGAA